MNIFQRIGVGIDHVQRRVGVFGFAFGVQKKYNDDQAGQQAALITYYGFLSLFPLLIVGTSVADFVAQRDTHLRAHLLDEINQFFPIGGQQLQTSIANGHAHTGVALIIGVVVAFYGARGIANAIRNMLDHSWAVPRAKRSGFPKNLIKSLLILVGGVLGLGVTGTITSYATATLGHVWYWRGIPLFINLCLLYLLFIYVLRVGTSRTIAGRDLRLGAILAAIGLLALQVLGVTLVRHDLRNLQGLYGQFGLVLAILVWIYAQAQVLVYAIEINVVKARKLWPRAFQGDDITDADRVALQMHLDSEKLRDI